MGRDRILESRPFFSPLELAPALSAINEAIRLNEEKQVSWSFSAIEDPNNSVAILKIKNAALEPKLLLDIAGLCSQALFVRSALAAEKETSPVLWGIVERISPDLLGAIGQITRKVLPGGEIDDSASPELAKLRREINLQRSRLSRSLESTMRSAGAAIQDAIVTVRNDRFVIPVKSEFRGRVAGVAHGYSSSGSTVFVEPLEAIDANNELQNLKGKEEREIARILFALTELLREQLPCIELSIEAVAELDQIKAKTVFARQFSCVVPEIVDDGTLILDEARHPLLEDNLRRRSAELDRQKTDSRTSISSSDPGSDRVIVPSSLALEHDRSVMIISGANAGGKTVVLKTAGLLALMAISGLPVPASRAKVPFYRSVLADIGDHQSLSSNLSTFSSHMSNIAEMIRVCVTPSLVLLDEAGTGTDPEEGSALGVAIVDHFRRKGAQVIASTHYRGLKMYAANDDSIVNASVEFDEKTLQPTYKLLIGLAGASSGIEIARRFGIDNEVADAARSNLDVSALEAEDYLRKLQTETRFATDLRIALEEEREATALKFAGLEVDALKKEKARQKQFESELAQAVDDFERRSKAFLLTLEDKALKSRLEKERLARKAELNRTIVEKMAAVGNHHVREGKTEARTAGNDRDKITVGSTVVTTFGNIGKIEKIVKDVAEVLVGGMRLREKITNLRLAEPPEAGAARSRSAGSFTGKQVDQSAAPAELDLIGKTTADAEYELDRFIDEAYMSSLPRVRIIHGFGTGALRKFVHRFLHDHDLVERFEFSSENQGGNGATIAEIKR